MIEHEAAGFAEIVAASAKRAPWGWAGLMGFMIALIKVWPIINDQLIKVKEKRRSDKRDDAAEWRAEMRKEVAELRAEVKQCQADTLVAKERAHKYEMRLMTVANAFQMVAGELRKVDPDNPTLKQAVDLVGLAITEDMGMNRALNELSRVPGVGE
ncbi:hypothetical protein ACQKJZ_04550 [Sphingomonas sp. NPDC019816]|uniref:hypothetical protein n=1 Tax=Sphingomonas sp. NPDC019816 TaxID=3390679 RepID=UPI003D05CC78